LQVQVGEQAAVELGGEHISLFRVCAVRQLVQGLPEELDGELNHPRCALPLSGRVAGDVVERGEDGVGRREGFHVALRQALVQLVAELPQLWIEQPADCGEAAVAQGGDGLGRGTVGLPAEVHDQVSDVAGGERSEVDRLAAGADRRQQRVEAGADEEQDRSGRRFLQRLEQGVGALLVHRVGIVDDRDALRG
jgi:hypothetical protein